MMNRRIQRTTHMLLIMTLLLAQMFGLLGSVNQAIAVEEVTQPLPSSARVPEHFEYITTINTDWGLPFGDGNCDILWIPPPNNTIIEVNNIRDLASRVVYDAYYWRNGDGAQVKFYQNVDHPDQIWINMAGSTVNYEGFGTGPIFNPDINDGFENGESQHNIDSDYAVMIRKVIEYAVAQKNIRNKRLMFTGHSQGGNVGQLIVLEAFLNDPVMREAYPQAWNDSPITLRDNEGNESTVPSTFPKEMLEPHRTFGSTLVQANNTVDGGVFIGSRPHWLVDTINNLKDPTVFTTFVSEKTDPIPGLFTAKTFQPFDTFGVRTRLFEEALMLLITLGTNNPLSRFFGVDKPNLNEFSLNPDYHGLSIAHSRSRVLFDDLTRSNDSAHGQSYLDGTLVEGQTAIWQLPAASAIADYSPPNTAGGGGTLRLRLLGGGGFDCRSAKIYTEEVGNDPRWRKELCKPQRNIHPDIRTVFEHDPNAPIYEPDGIPDTMWVDPDVLSGSEGNMLDPNYLIKQRAIVHYWSDTYGAPDGPNDRLPYSDKNHDDLRKTPLEQRQRYLGEFGIFEPIFGIVHNREYIVNVVHENGVIVGIEQIKPKEDCKKERDDDDDDDGGDGGDADDDGGGGRKRYPNGHPDDYEAPWTFEAPSGVNTAGADTLYLQSIVSDSGLDPWGSAWSQAVVNALQPRIEQAQTLNLTAAETYYRYMVALINYRQDQVAQTNILNSPQLNAAYEAATEQATSLYTQLQAEWSSGTRAGQPATADEILDYWVSQMEQDPALTTWQNHQEAQAWQAAAMPFVYARDQYMEQREASGGSIAFQRQIYLERIKVERAIRQISGLGILKGGLDYWTLATMSFSGIDPINVDPLKMAPEDAPPVIVVPTGALETYQQFPWSRTWFEQYTSYGGTLVVLAQAFGRDWELLPGGEVRGLGFEEDILCREASVNLINNPSYLVGIARDRPDLQLDGSFTQYPMDTKVILQRRTGNLMPAMIEYPYGLGKVVATSLYPDFAVINGMQSGDDFPFARSFFLYWWSQATNTPVETIVEPDQPFNISFIVSNPAYLPMDELTVKTNAMVNGPDQWRYRVHYAHYEYIPGSSMKLSLDPPLNPDEQRLVQVEMPATSESGLHRIEVNGEPNALYLVQSPVVYQASANIDVQRDQESYWIGEPATLTINITPTTTLQTTKTMQISEDNGFFYDRTIQLVPGQTRSIHIPFQVNAHHLKTPFKIIVRDTTTNNVQAISRFVLPAGAPPQLKLSAFTPTINTISATVMNRGGHGTSFSGTLQLSDNHGYVLHTQTISGVVGHNQRPDVIPTSQEFSMPLPGNQKAGKYILSYLLQDQSGDYWRGAVPLQLTGLSADISTHTDLPIYDPTQLITVSTHLTPSMSLDNSWLHLKIQKPIEDVEFSLLTGGLRGSDGQGRDAHFDEPQGVALSNDGRFALVSDTGNDSIRYVDMDTGDVRTIVGTGEPRNYDEPIENYYTDPKFVKDGIGQHALLWSVGAIDLSPDNSFALFADESLIRKLDLNTRRVTTIAGDPKNFECWEDYCFLAGGFVDDIGTSALLGTIRDIEISHDGTFALIGDRYGIRRLDLQTYEVTTVAGGTLPWDRTYTYNDGIGSAAEFGEYLYIALTPDDQTAYVVDQDAHVIRRLNLNTREVTTIVGQKGSISDYVDGIGLNARLSSPEFIEIDSNGAYALFGEPYEGTIRNLDLQSLQVTTVAGIVDGGTPYDCVDTDAQGTAAEICSIGAISFAENGTRLAFVGDDEHFLIRSIDIPTMDVTTVAGELSLNHGGNGIDRFELIGSVALLPDGKSALMLGDQKLWQIDVYTHEMVALAGQHYTTSHYTSSCEYADGIGDTVRFCNPEGLDVSPDASFAIIADTNNHVIRRYDLLTQEVTTIAGNGTCTDMLVDGIGAAAQLCYVRDLKISHDGSFALFIDDGINNRDEDAIRKLNLQTYEVSTLADDQTNPLVGNLRGLAIHPSEQIAIMGNSNYGNFVSINLLTNELTEVTPIGTPEDFDEHSFDEVAQCVSSISYTADGNTAFFFDGLGLKRWDLVNNSVYWVSDKFTGCYDGELDVTADGSRLLFAAHYGNPHEGHYDAALQMAELAITLHDEWIPLNGSGPQTITTPLVDPSLASDLRARGTLLLQTDLYGPQRTEVLIDQRQFLAHAYTYFEILPDSFTLSLLPEPAEVRLGAATHIQGVVRNSTAQTGVTLAITENGIALPNLVLSDLAPGQVATFMLPVNTSQAGFVTYDVSTPDGTVASAEVAVFAPGIRVAPLAGTTIISANTTTAFTTTIVNESPLEGDVSIQVGSADPTTFVLPGNSAISTTLTLDVPASAPHFWSVPVSISGDLQEQRVLQLEVVFPEPAVLDLSEVLVGVPSVGEPFTTSLDVLNQLYSIPNDPERFVDIPLSITQTGVISDINVQVSIAHSETSDLRIELISPHGQSVMLLSEYAAYGENLSETVFDDQGFDGIYAGSAPYTGRFQPSYPLSQLTGSSLAGEWRLRITDTYKNAYRGQVLDWKLIVTPQTVDVSAPIIPGQLIRVLPTFDVIKRGITVLNLEGLEAIAQQPLQIQAFEPMMASMALTVPETLPGGTFPLYFSVGGQDFQTFVDVQNWEADLAIEVPTASIQVGTLFTSSITISETAGISGSPTLYVRYGTNVVTEQVTLTPYSTQSIDVSFAADTRFRRVSASVANIAVDTDAPPFVALIDSRPINVHRFDASVELDMLQATSGTTGTGRLLIDGPVSYVRLQQPLALGGDVIWVATGVSETVVLGERDSMIDLSVTPTGAWEFAFALPDDMPSGRYALPFVVDGLEQPVFFDVFGPHITVHQSDLTGSSDLLSITFDLESTTAISVTPRIFYRGVELNVLSELELLFQAGSQDVTLLTYIPEWARGLGELRIVFDSMNGRELGGTQIQHQSKSVAILQADLLGPSITEPVTISTTLLGSGPITLTASTQLATLITETLYLDGYKNHEFAVLLPVGTSILSLTLTDIATGHQDVWPLNIELFVDDNLDAIPPIVSLNAPSGSFAATWTTPVTFTGTASDNLGLDQVRIGNTPAEVDPATGVFTAVIQLRPGIHNIKAIAQDIGGNLAESNEVSVDVAFIPPILNTGASATIQEGQAIPLTVTLNPSSALSATVRIRSMDGTATAGEDYVMVDHMLSFAVGQTTQTITVNILPDALREEPETLILTFSEPNNLELATTTVTITIIDQTAMIDHRLYLPLVRRIP